MYLGIEIGGTKLQFGVGSGTGVLDTLERTEVERGRGALGLLEQIERVGTRLLSQRSIERIGIGFGGPVEAVEGRVLKSHQIDGWNDFPLVAWIEKVLQRPAVMGNDADLAALAEATIGAGRGANPVFYVTVGSGVGGGLVLDRQVYRGSGWGAAEIGHMRPGLLADRPEATVESLASGWGIVAAAQARLSGEVSHPLAPLLERSKSSDAESSARRWRERWELVGATEAEFAADLCERCAGDLERLSAKLVAQAAREGNLLAAELFQHGAQALGWAIGQTITLMAPQVVVVGGGVSLAGADLFWEPLAAAVERYVFPPFRGRYSLQPAALGEEVVVHGAIALAARGA